MKKTVTLMLVTFMLLSGCAAMQQQNMYTTQLTVEQGVVLLMERYEMYYQLASEETKQEWSKVFDPAFEKLDLLLDTYTQLVADGMDTVSILNTINTLKTSIMIELVRRNQQDEG